jgi:hypothetical protein
MGCSVCKGADYFLLGVGGAKTREKKKGCHCIREKEIETNRHRIPAKEEEFVFLSFVLSFENNLYCVIVRFGCIGVLDLSDFLCIIFLYSIFHSEFLCDRLRRWTYLTLREPLKS